MTQRVLLCIMDGWGISTNHPEADATKLAHPVHVDKLEKNIRQFLFTLTVNLLVYRKDKWVTVKSDT